MNILSHVVVTGDNKSPCIANNGYSLDIYSPIDFSIDVNTYAKFKSGFILDLPEPYIGLLTTKAHSPFQIIVTSGSTIYPGNKEELYIEIQNISHTWLDVRKGDPILQIVVLSGAKLS